MKKNKKIFCFVAVVVLFSFQVGFAQTYADNEAAEELLTGEILNPIILANLGIDNSFNSRLKELEGNSVFLEQIGDLNRVNIKTQTESSEINILQNGNSNVTTIDYTAKNAFANLKQNGDFNNIRDVVSQPGEDISLDLIQEGDNLQFEREGVNELTKSLIFRQTEASPALIIRSSN